MLRTIIAKGLEPIKWLIVIAIAYTLATTLWVFFATPATPMVAKSQSAEQTNQPPPNINAILSRHMFGQVASTASQAPQTATITRLPLELQSVFVANESERSTAIVALRGKTGRMYRVGDTLPGNAKLEEVAHGQVYLRRAGARESLAFPKTLRSGSFSTELMNEELPSDTTDDADDADGAITTDESYANPRDETELSSGTITDLQKQLSADTQGTLDQLGIETAQEGGYRIGNSIEVKYLQQTGLQAGDVILSINGQPVGNPQEDQMQLDNIRAQGSARIEVQRGSRRFFVTARIPNHP